MKANKLTSRQILLIIVLGLVVYWALTNLAVIAGAIGKVLGLFSPLFLGLAIAFVVNLPLRMFEQVWEKLLSQQKSTWHRKLKRPVCLILSFIVILGLITALFFMLIPELTDTVESIISMVPQFISQITTWWSKLSDFVLDFGFELPEFTIDPVKAVDTITAFLSERGSGMLDKTVDITASIFSGIFDAVLAIAFSIYVLAQKEKLSKQCRRILIAVFPTEKVDHCLEVVALANRTFASFITGQVTEAVIIGVLCGIGMLIFGMPYVLPVSVLVGFTALIPVFGAFIGTGIGAFLILMVSPMKAFWFIVFIIVLQQLEGNLIYPRVVGKSVGLPGIWVLAAVTVGGSAFGVVGMLLGVPICAVFYTLGTQAIDARLARKKEAGELSPHHEEAAKHPDADAQEDTEPADSEGGAPSPSETAPAEPSQAKKAPAGKKRTAGAKTK